MILNAFDYFGAGAGVVAAGAAGGGGVGVFVFGAGAGAGAAFFSSHPTATSPRPATNVTNAKVFRLLI